MPCHIRFVLVMLIGLSACGGGGSPGTTAAIPPGGPVVAAPSGAGIQLGLQATRAQLPVVAQITGTVLFPAVSTPVTIALTASATAPAGVGLESVKRARSGTLTVYEYLTIVSPISVTLPGIPAFTLNFPASTPLAGKSFFYGISDLNAQGGLVSFDTQGPGTRSGQNVSFASVPTALTFKAGHRYTFVVYAMGAPAAVQKLYVADVGNNTLTTYTTAGTRTTPTIVAGLTGLGSIDASYAGLGGVAVDTAGKIYLGNLGEPLSGGGISGPSFGFITTYNANGTQTTPTITDGLANSQQQIYRAPGIAVDTAGTIYAANAHYNDDVTTYAPDGTMKSLSISPGRYLQDVAVDKAGKIYTLIQEGSGNLVIFTPNGTAALPQIGPLGQVVALTIDAAGKIYVVDDEGKAGSRVLTFDATGKPTTPTITVGLNSPDGVAVDAAGRIYVANGGSNTITTYNPNGTQTALTITTGLDGPGKMALR
jgi:hypothetical protein